MMALSEGIYTAGSVVSLAKVVFNIAPAQDMCYNRGIRSSAFSK